MTCPICKRLILDGEPLKRVNTEMQRSFDNVIIMAQDLLNFWKMQCNECHHTFVSLRNIKELYQCPKCKQFNCQQVEASSDIRDNLMVLMSNGKHFPSQENILRVFDNYLKLGTEKTLAALLQVYNVSSYEEIDIQNLCYLVNALNPYVTTVEKLITLEHEIERDISSSLDQQFDDM